MKKKFLFPLMLLLLCLFSGTAYAEPSADSGEQRTREFILTEENRYTQPIIRSRKNATQRQAQPWGVRQRFPWRITW